MRNDPNALEVDPVYCWHGHGNVVGRFQRAVFMQAPLRVLFSPSGFKGVDRLVFFHVQDGESPVLPDDFVKALKLHPTVPMIVTLRKYPWIEP